MLKSIIDNNMRQLLQSANEENIHKEQIVGIYNISEQLVMIYEINSEDESED